MSVLDLVGVTSSDVCSDPVDFSDPVSVSDECGVRPVFEPVEDFEWRMSVRDSLLVPVSVFVPGPVGVTISEPLEGVRESVLV